VRTVADLLHDYQHVIESLEVVTGSGGVFLVEVDGAVLYSKAERKRHAEPGEVLRLFREKIAPDVPVYER
jgi:predicted Rdx family selenoprotein